MDSLLTWQGGDALTLCRLEKLASALRKQLPLTHLDVKQFYLIATDPVHSITPEQIASLQEILGDITATDIQSAAGVWWVVPRIGTLSAWSSKATDILHNCGLTVFHRIEKGLQYSVQTSQELTETQIAWLRSQIHDALTESVLSSPEQFKEIFSTHVPQPLQNIPVLEQGLAALTEADQALGLSLSAEEMQYLLQRYTDLKRNPTDAELMMFAQINSEHCRHKIFNANWTIDGVEQLHSLFKMIRNTQAKNGDNVWVAYKDNAAVLKADNAQHFWVNPWTHQYQVTNEAATIVFKVETHNHPTAISPKAGAATGSGGEIRDEAATGRGSTTRAGLVGFSVSHLHIPDWSQPWEYQVSVPKQLASALQIMLDGPIGAAEYNNEFGRPCLTGYFRSFEYLDAGEYRAYHKPIMIAGGIGFVRQTQMHKEKLTQGALLIVLGGPALPIGLGGGSASSHASGVNDQALDFASVQRANAEIERRAQEVINHCWLLGDANPILSIHDVGAGGLANAMPELIHSDDLGGHLKLRAIPNAAPAMSPLEIWCNEAQERYVLAVHPDHLALFSEIAERERCPFSVIGEATNQQELIVEDEHFNNNAVDLPMRILFDEWPPLKINTCHRQPSLEKFSTAGIAWADAVRRVLSFPCVADKSFLITIGDRSVTGLVARDQMVGPWQVPVSDVAVTANDYFGISGAAMTMGERAPVALINPAASARLAVGEALTNMTAAMVGDLAKVSLSANWMAAVHHPGESAALYDAVQAVGMELCPELGISIPVGKDSLSMSSRWHAQGQSMESAAPLSLIISAAASVQDIRKTLTPLLNVHAGESCLLLVDLGEGRNALGASALAQVYQMLGDEVPDLNNVALLKSFFNAIQALNAQNLLLAYHDRSDGGLLASICEMSFASHVGLTVDLSVFANDPMAALFAEELGAVVQIKRADLTAVLTLLQQFGLSDCVHVIAELNTVDEIIIKVGDQVVYSETRVNLHRTWSELSFRMQAMRDNPVCAQEQYDALLAAEDPGLNAKLSFSLQEKIEAPFINLNAKPKVAILREQGVNGHVEMAAAFAKVGFDSIDVHMSDVQQGRVQLKEFAGLVACGGFSYGDVLGAGRGWAQSILLHSRARDEFTAFFARSDSFSLGVCNGCQLFSQLKAIVPGTGHWPEFKRNLSEQFEARLSLVEVVESPSIFFRGMAGSVMPITIAHGEGRARFTNADAQEQLIRAQQVSLRFVDSYHQPAVHYPANPNGSPAAITGVCNQDGRVTILMPHPERVVRRAQFSWAPEEWNEDSPWLRFFANARIFVS